MGQFSDDGQWWWNGKQWIATSQVVLPDLPMTEFERSGKLEKARAKRKQSGWFFWANSCATQPITALSGIALIIVVPAGRAYRLWTIEQLELATAYLLGPDEPLLAGEGGTLVSNTDTPPWRRDLAVAVTAAHVLVFRFDSLEGQPRWIAMAARLTDVTMALGSNLDVMFRSGPGLVIRAANGQWEISGQRGAFKRVLDTWQRADDRKVGTG